LNEPCERIYQPSHHLDRYCSPECLESARRWQVRFANQLYRRSENGKLRRKEQAQRYRLNLKERKVREAALTEGKSELDPQSDASREGYIIQGVARACCALGYRVRYETSASLLEELMRAAGAKTLPSALLYYRSFDLLIIDEFGFDKLERREYPESPSMLYKVVDSRNGRGSTAFLTNVDFGDWTEYFGDPALVMALLDRVSDNAIVLRFEGKFYRKSRTKQAT
jgi:hypothetical protein